MDINYPTIEECVQRYVDMTFDYVNEFESSFGDRDMRTANQHVVQLLMQLRCMCTREDQVHWYFMML